MTDLEQLRESQKNADWWIAKKLSTRITRPYKDCEGLGDHLSSLLRFYRIRGILGHLLDADRGAFVADLTREALTYLTLLKAHQQKLDVSKELVNASTYSPMTSALATGNFPLAAEIDELMPHQFGKYDGEEAFAFTNTVRALTIGTKKDVDVAQTKLAAVAKSEPRWAPVVEIVRGLKDEDAETFNAGLSEYLASLEGRSEEEIEELAAGEEHVSVEGLAFIQLAKKRSLKVRVKHHMVPPELQNTKPAMPGDGYPSWPG